MNRFAVFGGLITHLNERRAFQTFDYIFDTKDNEVSRIENTDSANNFFCNTQAMWVRTDFCITLG